MNPDFIGVSRSGKVRIAREPTIAAEFLDRAQKSLGPYDITPGFL
jgi:hypothetical protein